MTKDSDICYKQLIMILHLVKQAGEKSKETLRIHLWINALVMFFSPPDESAAKRTRETILTYLQHVSIHTQREKEILSAKQAVFQKTWHAESKWKGCENTI